MANKVALTGNRSFQVDADWVGGVKPLADDTAIAIMGI